MDDMLYRKGVALSKYALLKLAECHSGLPLVSPKAKRVLLYHRFSKKPDLTGIKTESRVFDWQLSLLKRSWNVLTLGQFLAAFHKKQTLPARTAVITIDDGYLDFYEVAYPLLLKYNLPATFFPTINFVVGHSWLWPDILSYILDKASGASLKIVYEQSVFQGQIENPGKRRQLWQQLSDFCSELPDRRKWDFIRALSKMTGVKVPPEPVVEYAPVNYDQLREMSQNGIEIGAHSLNHPILSRVDENVLEKELCEPKEILEAQLGIEIHSLAYPSGRAIDINATVVQYAKKCGYLGAVVTRRDHEWYTRPDPFQVPRIGVGNSKTDFCWKLYGFELFAETAKSHLAG